MNENDVKLCDSEDCDKDCEHCESADKRTVDIEKLNAEELRVLYKTQSELVVALVNENESLVKQNEDLTAKIEKGNSYLDQLAHMKNDFENYKRRTNASKDNAKDEGKMFVVTKVLPILDTFARAEENLQGTMELESFKMIYRQFEKVLGEIGLEEVEVLGRDFDPNLSFAITKDDRGAENVGKVVEVWSKGYRYKDKIVKYSQVIVGC